MTTRILIIDPDISFMVSLKQALEGTGEFRVSVSANGPAAEDSLQRERHDIAVLDFEVPELDVMELIADLRRIQPDLPIIMTPQTDLHRERARFLDIQGVLPKPYMARDLIPHLRGLAGRASARPAPDADEFVPPAMPSTLRHLMPEPQADLHPTPSPTELLDDVERDKLGEHFAEPEAILDEFEVFEESGTRYFEEAEADFETKQLTDLPDTPAKTTALLQWDAVPPTSQLTDTHELADRPQPAGTVRFSDETGAEAGDEDLLGANGWVEHGPGTRLFEPFLGEPPTQEEDTPTVPPHDLPGVRQFLATDVQEHDPTTFGEVLDAVAQSPPRDRPLSPDEAAFHQLVDSMRAPEERRTRRRWLEDLLASIAVDTARTEDASLSGAGETELDYVLDAIRRGQSPSAEVPGDDRPEAAPDDITIGDVMQDLFDPSFESVLEALAGEDIDDEDFAEPTYGGSPLAGVDAPYDAIAPGDVLSERDAPEWLRAYEAEGLDLAELELDEEAEPVDEPPVAAEDSSRYPATAALTAVSRDEASEDFSLNQLLSQIEQQLPPPRSGRPHLKPLPSWGDASALESAQSLESLFDRMEGAAPEGASDEELAALDDSDALEQLLNLVEASVSEEPFAESDELADEIAEAFYAGVQTEAELTFGADDDAARAGEEMAAYAGDEDMQAAEGAAVYAGDEDAQVEEAVFEEPLETAQEFAAELEDLPAAYAEAGEAVPLRDEIEEIVPIDDDHLIPVPVEAAARLLSGEGLTPAPEEDDEAALAQIAVQLTQYSLESSAQATMLSRPGEMLAGAGNLPDSAMERLFEIVDSAWQTRSSDDTDSLIRYITLPDAGDFLLYSKLVPSGLSLSMVFHLDTTVSVIRRQAQRLSQSLELVPEAEEAPPVEEPAAARTAPSRPTDVRRPEDWRIDEDMRIEDEAGVLQRPGSQEEADMGFTCVWMPRDPGQELVGDFAEDLREWVFEIGAEHGWRVDTVEVNADFIAVSLCVPQKAQPDEVITQLMDETTHRSSALHPEWLDGYQPLWADGYYLVMPPRDLSDREIARFITYQRQAQIG